MESQLKQSQNADYRTVFLLYELGQVEMLECFWRGRPEERINSLVVALALDIEVKLMEQGIPFSSGRKYKQSFTDPLTMADEMTAAFFADPRWAMFNHRGVPFKTTFMFMFGVYLQRILYYGNLLISIIEINSSVKRFVLFTPSGGAVSKVAGGLAGRERWVVVDCAKAVAATRGIAVTVIPPPLSRASLRDFMRPFFFTVQRVFFGLFLIIWNRVIAILCRPRHPRLLISDYWKNVGPAIELLNGGECIFRDRMEIRQISWRMLLRYRMRFVHSENFLSRNIRRRARERARELARQWSEMRIDIAPVFVCRGYSFDALLRNAIDNIVCNFEKLICEIEGTYAMYECLRPDMVLLRASVSGQTHFSVLPLVAKNCGIPSLELQHGLEYLGPGSLSREHVAEYMAVYGPLIKKELLSIGYASRGVYNTGSPRFDSYRADTMNDKERISLRPFIVLCVAPDVSPLEGYDSYDAEDYFNAVAKAAESIPNAQVIIKLRPGPADEELLRIIIADAFAQVPHIVAKSESMPSLFAQADAVVSCYSTVILEALQCGMPVIIPALNPIAASMVSFHFSSYRDARALYIAYTHKELVETLTKLAVYPATRDSMRKEAQAFLGRNFCFDGNSSRRLVALITKIAIRSAPDTRK